jgi:hypothetical protein
MLPVTVVSVGREQVFSLCYRYFNEKCIYGSGSVIAIILSLKYIDKKILLAILVPLLFFILLSSGGIFKTIFYHILPLLGYVRLNGEFTYFRYPDLPFIECIFPATIHQ